MMNSSSSSPMAIMAKLMASEPPGVVTMWGGSEVGARGGVGDELADGAGRNPLGPFGERRTRHRYPRDDFPLEGYTGAAVPSRAAAPFSCDGGLGGGPAPPR